MIKSITNVLIIFFIFQQIQSKISQINQNAYNPFWDETLQIHTMYGHIVDQLTPNGICNYPVHSIDVILIYK